MENLDSLKIASKLLKSQREKLKISIEEVSVELRLDKKIIEEIETRNFSNFKNYVFLKGYLKNYANYLGIELDLPEMKRGKKSKLYNKSNFKKNNKQILTKYSKLLAILLIIIVALTFMEQKKFNDNSAEDNNIISKEKDSNNKVIIKDNNLKENLNYYEGKNNLDLNKNNSANNDTENSNSDENKQKNEELDNLVNNIDKNALPANSKDNLVIEYTEDSWTEIIDSFNNIVFFDLVKKGKILEFNILPPFEILLGDATVVNIKYNNKKIQVPFNPGNKVGKLKIKN
tara:strand:+ start:709 stop:1569 length:861 start_codon:yes stop_codon:yes gene_type:complete